MIRYFGVLSSHASRRREVVPAPKPSAGSARQLDLFDQDCGRKSPARNPWAWLLRHVFQVDVSTCPTCGGRMRLLETATRSEAIARLLAKHGLGPRPPPPPLAQSPPGQLTFAFMKRA
jgi:hypothetical protein